MTSALYKTTGPPHFLNLIYCFQGTLTDINQTVNKQERKILIKIGDKVNF